MKILQKKEKYFQIYIMQIDYALILSAGLGTRMGEIGKFTPKVLWPIYFKTLLELQICYCQDLGIKKIYINTHYLHAELVKFLHSVSLSESVTLLHEEILLDSGGAIHNFAARDEINYQGNLLLVNGDQFLFFEDSLWHQAIDRIQSCRAVLFGIKVDKNSSYNETVTTNNKLIDIKKNTQKNHEYITYSGLGLLNLNGMIPVKGVSKFFETVADFKFQEIEVLTPSLFEYWDFGTSDIYAKNIFKLKYSDSFQGLMFNFLEKHSAFVGDQTSFVDFNTNAIDLEFSGHFVDGTIHSRGVFQKI